MLGLFRVESSVIIYYATNLLLWCRFKMMQELDALYTNPPPFLEISGRFGEMYVQTCDIGVKSIFFRQASATLVGVSQITVPKTDCPIATLPTADGYSRIG